MKRPTIREEMEAIIRNAWRPNFYGWDTFAVDAILYKFVVRRRAVGRKG